LVLLLTLLVDVLFCAVPCCAVPCHADVPCSCAVLCCAVLCRAISFARCRRTTPWSRCPSLSCMTTSHAMALWSPAYQPCSAGGADSTAGLAQALPLW